MHNIDKARYFIKKAAVHSYLRSMLRNIKLEKIAADRFKVKTEDSRSGKYSKWAHRRKLEDTTDRARRMLGINNNGKYPHGIDFAIADNHEYEVKGPLMSDSILSGYGLEGDWRNSSNPKDEFQAIAEEADPNTGEFLSLSNDPEFNYDGDDIEKLYQLRDKFQRRNKMIANHFRRAHDVNEDPMSDRGFAQWYGNTPDSDPEKQRLTKTYGADYFKNHQNAYMMNR